MNDIGTQIRLLRGTMSQRALAKKIKVTQSAIAQWESGLVTPRMSRLTRIAKALGVTVEQLMFGKAA